MRRLLLAFGIAGSVLLTGTVTASAHSLVRVSDPADGARLDHAPTTVLITFTEPPEAGLSTIRVLDTEGRQLVERPAAAVAGLPSTVAIALPPIGNGVYTVTWRTVSAIDGHVATGAFAFAVGAEPVPPIPLAPPQQAPPPSALGVVGRWGLDAGYGLLLGGAWVELLALADFSMAVLLLVALGDVLAITGALMVVEAARESAGVAWSTFIGTSLARGMAMVVIPVVAAGLAVVLAWALRGVGRRLALAACALFSLVAMFSNAIVSHAASSSLAWLMIPTHWLHVVAFAVWIGGLAAVLVGIRGRPTVEKANAVGRFSLVAGVAFATMILTGLLRGIDDVGSLSKLLTTSYGWLLIGKTALFFGIAPLAAMNRWRYVRMGIRGIPALRRVSGGEILLAGVIMVAAAFLTILPPPSFIRPAVAGNFPHAGASGRDYTGAVAMSLDAAPGAPGLNRFDLTVLSSATGRPVTGARVYLLFDLAGHPELGESTMQLREVGGGLYAAVGTRMSLAGRWTVTAVVETSRTSYAAALALTAAPPG